MKTIIFTGGAHFVDALQQCKTIEQLNYYWSTVPDDFKNLKCWGDKLVNVDAFEKRIAEILMQKYNALTNEMEAKTSEAIRTNGVFFAFSKTQFEENKTTLEDRDKYIDIDGGGFMPNSKADNFFKQMEDNTIWFDSQIKEQGLEETEIEYELGNHECYYTGSINDAVAALGDKYTRDQILVVYCKNRDIHNDECGTPFN